MATLGFDKPCAAFFLRKWPPCDLTSPVLLGTIPAGAFFLRKLTSSNFTMLMLADFVGVLMIFVSFHDTFPQCPPDLSWGLREEIFSHSPQLRALYLRGVICSERYWTGSITHNKILKAWLPFQRSLGRLWPLRRVPHSTLLK